MRRRKTPSAFSFAKVLHDGELRRVAGPKHNGRHISQCTAEEASMTDVSSWFGPKHAAGRIPLLAFVLLRYRASDIFEMYTHLHVVRPSRKEEEISATSNEQLVASQRLALGRTPKVDLAAGACCQACLAFGALP